jgi:modulator of FtsH protease HflK
MPWSNQGGGPWGSGPKGPWGSGPQSSGPTPPDFEEFLRRSQDRLRSVLPGGALGGRGLFIILLLAVVAWAATGYFTVQPDEVGIVLRFGKYDRVVQPGPNYHWPYPIESALTPQALRTNRLDIGMRMIGTTPHDIPEESLMLTGDQNIVDVEFTVLWSISPRTDGPSDFLFNLENPQGTVKAVAESAMREVIGRSDISVILTGGQQNSQTNNVEAGVKDLMQKTLDQYKAGILINDVNIQKVNPPEQVMDAARDVQAALTDLDRMQNEAQTYANRIIPEARGLAAKTIQDAEAYREQTVAEAKGQVARFNQIYEQYKKAPQVTRERMYLETMERVLGGTDKLILDPGNSVVPYLPLTPSPTSPSPPQNQTGGSR